jgi:ribosomal protein S18 acetylase RimI-like enzyme
MSALKQALDHSQRIASMAMVVDAKDDPAKAFYKKYGFLELPDHPNRLFLPMKTVEQMFGA